MSEPKLLTAEQLQILQHALGLDEYGLCHYYRDGVRHHGFMPTRNYFCAGGNDEDRCKELIVLGYMKQHHIFPCFNCSVTDAGKEAVRRESPAPPKLTRSQKRYLDFLAADTGYSFREWLEMQKEARC